MANAMDGGTARPRDGDPSGATAGMESERAPTVNGNTAAAAATKTPTATTPGADGEKGQEDGRSNGQSMGSEEQPRSGGNADQGGARGDKAGYSNSAQQPAAREDKESGKRDNHCNQITVNGNIATGGTERYDAGGSSPDTKESQPQENGNRDKSWSNDEPHQEGQDVDHPMDTPTTPEERFEELSNSARNQPMLETAVRWETSVDEIFQAVYSSMTFGIKRHKVDDGYPAISQEEATELVKLFRVFHATSTNRFTDWIVIMREIGRVMHQSIWTLTQIAASIADRLRIGPIKLEGPWGNKKAPEEAAKFACDPKIYSEEERKEIIEYCQRAFQLAVTPREPTELEWKIMVGLTEGSVIGRHLPQFLRRLCGRR